MCNSITAPGMHITISWVSSLLCSGCELCSVLQAQAFGQGLSSWYLRRCSSCWQQHAKLHTQQAVCQRLLQQQRHSSSQPASIQQHSGSSTAEVQDGWQSSQQLQHANLPCMHNNDAAEHQVPYSANSNSSSLIQALDLAGDALSSPTPPAAVLRATSAAGNSRSSRPASHHYPHSASSRTCQHDGPNHTSSSSHSSTSREVQNNQQGLQTATAGSSQQRCKHADATTSAEQQAACNRPSRVQFEVNANPSASQALDEAGSAVAAGLPGASHTAVRSRPSRGC